MSTATVKLKHGALATVTPDFMITRGITETHSLTLLNADNTPFINASVVTWTFQIAQDFLSRTSILAESTSITFTDNVLSGILLNAHTVELKAFMQGKAIVPLYGTLIGLNGSAEVVTAITFRIVCTNSVYEPDAEPTPAIISQYLTAAQIYALFADIESTLNIPRDVADLTDNDGLLFDGDYNSLQNIPDIPADVSDLTDSDGLLFDGDYNSLQNIPAIPTDISDLTDSGGLLFDGDYDSLDNKPTIPTDLSTLTDNTGLFAAKANSADIIIYVEGTGIDITDGTVSIDTTGATTGQIISKSESGVAWVNAPVSATTANVQAALSINTGAGSETKVLSERGTFVDLPEGGSTGGLTSDDALMMILAFS